MALIQFPPSLIIEHCISCSAPHDGNRFACRLPKKGYGISRKQVITGVIFLIFAAGTFSCGTVKPELERSNSVEETRSEKISIAYLKSLYRGSPCKIENNFHIRARVISSDRCRNFYKTLVIQDETGGISLKIDIEEYFQLYYAGDEITVSCNSLILGSYGGLVQLGAESYDRMYEVGFIPFSRTLSVIDKIDDSWVRPKPVVLKLNEIAREHINCFVAFDNVRFVDEELGSAWCEEDADTDRHIVDVNGNRLTVRTGRYASFARDLLPRGSGYIEGVLSCFDNTYQLIVVDIYGVEMN